MALRTPPHTLSYNPDASLKGLHKHIDIEPPPALAAFVIILGKTMKTINQANEQQMHSKDNLFDIVACKIAEATKEGSSCVQIRLPVGYDEEVVKDIVCYLTVKMYAVTWHHTIDCIEVSWKWADVERMKKRNHMR